MSSGQRQSLQLALLEAVNFSTNPDGFLLFTGEPGCGKTHLAVAIAQTLLQQNIATLFVVVPDLLDHLRATFDKDADVSFDVRWEAVRNVAVLVLDDFGTQSDTAWAKEKLYQIVNYRLNQGLPLVLTSNWTLADFDAYHPRIASRLRTATHVRITAPDARRPAN